mgnify:CR=1 FL=1
MFMLEESFIEFINNLWGHLFDPNKRLFLGYLITTLLLATYVWIRTQRSSSLVRHLFSKKIWLHKSAKLDYAVWLINAGIKTFLIVPLLFSAAAVAISISFALEDWFGDIPPVILNKTHVAIVFTLMLFLLDDFSRFLLHFLMHKVPFLWRIHQVHHSAEVMTPFTVYRVHPIESALYAMRLVLSQGISLGIAFYLFGHRLDVVDVLGANIFVFLFNGLGANLRHSHIWLTWWKPIEKWFISPAQHQIHHSKATEHYDKNFGSALAIWDRLFGTLVLSKSVNKTLTFGLSNNPHKSLISLYLKPLTFRK